MSSVRHRYLLVVGCVLAVGIAVRTLPLYWTAYPFNPDGFRFARQGATIVSTGAVPTDISSHGLGFPVMIAALGHVTGVDPLWLTQPTIAVVGAIPPVIAVALVRRRGLEIGWSSWSVRVGALVAGLALATEGVYLRRTVTVSYEVLGILLVVVVAIAAHRWLVDRRPAWLGVVLVCLAVLPVTHHLSSMMAGLVLTALLSIHVHRWPERAVGGGGPIVLGFWAYFGLYYWLTRPPYYDDLAAAPDVFLAWVIVLVIGVVWLATTSDRMARFAVGGVFVVGFGMLALNALSPWSPGMMATPPLLLAGVAPLAVIALFASWGVSVGRGGRTGPLLIALFCGPLAFVFFGLTAGVTPEYQEFARRSQTFLHLATMVFAALAAIEFGRRVNAVGGAAGEQVDRITGAFVWRSAPLATACAVLLVCAAVTLPLAFAGLSVYSYQGTTTHEEFGAVTFASERVPGEWTSDNHLTRVAGEYYRAGGEYRSVYEWAHSGVGPSCSVLTDASWSGEGTQLFPAGPRTIDAAELDRVRTERQHVYASGELDFIVPADGTNRCIP